MAQTMTPAEQMEASEYLKKMSLVASRRGFSMIRRNAQPAPRWKCFMCSHEFHAPITQVASDKFTCPNLDKHLRAVVYVSSPRVPIEEKPMIWRKRCNKGHEWEGVFESICAICCRNSLLDVHF